ncbi:hypothetical protein NG99_10860 [Erwinia typographi]|uniref:Halovibrin HvnA n=2 Tax=Erwinia typographi TaxID=371042 RepID=A0A0A4A8A1_9GAMM|nr:hypothetical protein NG99_10860 [Erwinia typographi]
MLFKFIFFVFFLILTVHPLDAKRNNIKISVDYEKRERACGSVTDRGDKILCYIKYDYSNTAVRCDQDDNKPGVLCSGVIFRGTDSDLNRSFHSWNPSPTSVISGGVSFSYLRKDSSFNKTAYGYVTGFIFYPMLFTPVGMDSSIKVLCGFPLDAWTSGRSDKGCGEYNSLSDTRPCIEQGIETASQWYDTYHGRSGQNTCGFTLYSSGNAVNTSKLFDAMIKSQILLKESSFDEQNELRLEVWSQDKADIPLEAFFYLSGSSIGLKSSQKDQEDFYSEFSLFIPIIEVKFPDSIGGEAEFSFSKNDQVVTY